MAKMTPRSIIQRLESLQRAGITHIKRIKVRPAAPPMESSATNARATPPMQSPPPVKSAGIGVGATTLKSAAPLPPQRPVSVAAAPTSNDPRSLALAEVACDVANCVRCDELARTRIQTVFGVGNPYATLVFCGEAPGADEDRQGEPFVGRAGQLLTDIIVKGMKMRREDVYILNVLRCRPPGNRTPLPHEAEACREFLDRQLAIIQPKFICCLGAVAAQNLLGTTETIGHLRGRIHDLHGIKVVCTYHPAYLLRNPPAKRFVWDDIQMLMAEMGMPTS